MVTHILLRFQNCFTNCSFVIYYKQISNETLKFTIIISTQGSLGRNVYPLLAKRILKNMANQNQNKWQTRINSPNCRAFTKAVRLIAVKLLMIVFVNYIRISVLHYFALLQSNALLQFCITITLNWCWFAHFSIPLLFSNKWYLRTQLFMWNFKSNISYYWLVLVEINCC